MSQRFARSTAWIVDRPSIAVALMILMSVVAMIGYRAPYLVTDWWRQPSAAGAARSNAGNDEASDARPPNVNPLSFRSADAILVVQGDSFFTPRGAAELRAVVDALEALPYVANVLWMDRVPVMNIFGLPEPILPRNEASQFRFDVAREKALSHPLVGGQLLSPDGRTLLLLVSFDFFFVERDEDCTARLRDTAQAVVDESKGPPMDIHVTGRLPIYLTARKSHEVNQFRYQLIGYGTIALMSLILFRGIAAVVVVALAPSLGVFWTLGFLRFGDFQDNPFNDVVLPVLLSLVGLTDGVHLMVQIRRLRASGLAAREAARQGLHDVGMACGLTSLTTAIGFGSLALAHHEIVREFGWCCVVGVVITFVAVITSIPLACSTWIGNYVHVGQEKSLIDRHLSRISGLIDFVLLRTGAVSYGAIAICALLAAVTALLRPDERNSNALPDGSEPVVAMRIMDRAMGGLEFGQVEVRWNRDVPDDSREVLDVVGQVDDVLRREPLIGTPLSIYNLLQALPGDPRETSRMSMLELLPPPLKRAFYTPEYRRAEVSFRVQDLGIAKYGPVFERIEAQLARIQVEHPDFQLSLGGRAAWRWRNLYQIVVDLASSLGTASLTIFAVLAIAFRSLRIGLISVVPNLFPLALAGAWLWVTGQALELVSVCAFTICLGIAVDDTIHFLTRFQEEQKRTSDPHLAIRRAFTGVGTALIMTTVVLVAGFSTVMFSGSRDHRIFATMGTITLTAALFGDLIFLPALLARFAKRVA